MTGLHWFAGGGQTARIAAIAIVLTLTLTGCARPRVYSTDEMIAAARTYCVSAMPNQEFDSRDAACGYYQSHFVKSSVGTPQDLLAYIQATRTQCDLDPLQCAKYWNSVSEDRVLEQSYPGIDVRDPLIWGAKRAAVRACTDDGPDRADARPAACRQAARLLRGDGLAPELLRQIEHKACDLGEVDECHYATMDGETVDIKASQEVAAAHARRPSTYRGTMTPYGPMQSRTITLP